MGVADSGGWMGAHRVVRGQNIEWPWDKPADGPRQKVRAHTWFSCPPPLLCECARTGGLTSRRAVVGGAGLRMGRGESAGAPGPAQVRCNGGVTAQLFLVYAATALRDRGHLGEPEVRWCGAAERCVHARVHIGENGADGMVCERLAVLYRSLHRKASVSGPMSGE